jgi:hypothetical protein
VVSTRNAGTLVPSQSRAACIARRRSGGVVSTTYAAATPADAITTLATVRAFSCVTTAQLRRVPPPLPDVEPGPEELDPGPVCVPVAELLPDWLPLPRMASELPP